MLSSLWMALRVFLVYLRTSLPDRISSSWINACYSHHIVHALVNARCDLVCMQQSRNDSLLDRSSDRYIERETTQTYTIGEVAPKVVDVQATLVEAVIDPRRERLQTCASKHARTQVSTTSVPSYSLTRSCTHTYLTVDIIPPIDVIHCSSCAPR